MLLRRWNVTVGTVGQLNHHHLAQGTLVFELQTGQRVSFIWRGRDSDIPNANRLDNDFGRLHFVQQDLLAGIDLRPILGIVLCHRVKSTAQGQDIPVIILTSAGQDTGVRLSTDTLEETNWIKANDYLEKPISPRDLVQYLNEKVFKID